MEFINYFSDKIKKILSDYIRNELYLYIEEIRLRNNQKIIIKMANQELLIDYITTTEDLLKTLEKITENSIYTYQNQICNGFITVKGGHRVGITGNVAIENNKVINIVYVYSINFRIARQVKNCSNNIIKYIYKSNDSIYNTLIIGAPGSGKTTMLRDIIRSISNGTENLRGLTVGVIDERSEISAMYKGIPQTDLGCRTDVLENIPKILGIKMMIRSMAPEVIAVDEIGGYEDAENINYAMCSGVRGIFTAHGESLRDLNINPELKNLIDRKIIEKIIVLSNKNRGKVSKIYYLDNGNYEYRECC